VRSSCRPSAKRAGAIVPLAAIMLVVLLAFVALGVDLGYIAAVESQLQNAADSAALAGASQLLDPGFLQGMPNQAAATHSAMDNARAQAQLFAQDNSGGGVPLSLDPNNGNNASGDIVVGYIANPSNRTSPLIPSGANTGNIPNSVQVLVHRDNVRNGSLSLFFARILGINTWNLDATATATYQGGVTGFKIQTPGYATCKLLPYALDVNTWNNVVAGNGPDNFARNSTTGAVSDGSDGVHECTLFPLSNGGGGQGLQPGNFGTVNIGASNNSTNTLVRQILYGPNASDLAYYPGGVVQLDPTTQTLMLNGDTGISAGAKAALAAIIGQPRIIPLFSTVDGPGNNCMYTIVGFAGITITEVVLTGSLSTKHITIQPCWCIDANAVGGGTSSSSTFIVKPLCLTR
jgi:Flp pilus assembly protein TadG